MLKQALPDFISQSALPPVQFVMLCPFTTSRYSQHLSLPSPSFSQVPRGSPSTPRESYKEQENPHISFTKMAWSGSLCQKFEWFGVNSREEQAPGTCIIPLRAASISLPFEQGGQRRTFQPWVGPQAVTPAALTGASVPGDPLRQFPCDCSYQLLKIRGTLE